jgi:hypothetical protein
MKWVFMEPSLSNPKLDKYLQLAIILLVGLPHLLIIVSNQDIVLTWFNTDDAFYYFKTAQNIVEGQGVSFDGIARTNGYHPLWLMVLLPIFTLAKYDLILPLRFVIALQVALGLGSALILYRFGRTLVSPWTAFLIALIWSFTPTIHEVVFKGGTEAGLNAFFMVLFVWLFYRICEQIKIGEIHLWRIFGLGVLAAITLLSRLDNVYLVFIFGGWLVLRFWRTPGQDTLNLISTFKWWLRLGLAYFGPLVGTLGMYLVINQVYFGSAMPVSGKVKRWWGTLKYTVYGNPPKDIQDFFEAFFTSSDSLGPWSLVMSPLNRVLNSFSTLGLVPKILMGVLLVGVLTLLAVALIRNYKFFIQAFWRWNLIPLLAACFVQIVYYKAFGHIAQKGWYWIAEMLFVVLVLEILLEIFAREIRKLPAGNKIVTASAFVLVVMLIAPYIQISARALAYSPGATDHFYLERARFLEDNTEPGSLIGMTGSGSSGYFVKDRTVVNLDGLISSVEYFIHLQNSTADEYLESIGLDYVFGNAYILQNSNPYQWNFDNRLEEFRYFVVSEDKTLVLFKFR